jgi:hypothetical protein
LVFVREPDSFQLHVHAYIKIVVPLWKVEYEIKFITLKALYFAVESETELSGVCMVISNVKVLLSLAVRRITRLVASALQAT